MKRSGRSIASIAVVVIGCVAAVGSLLPQTAWGENQPPVANDQSCEQLSCWPFNLSPYYALVTDAEDSFRDMLYELVEGPSHGSLAYPYDNPDTGVREYLQMPVGVQMALPTLSTSAYPWLYTPDLGYGGSDHFRWRCHDSGGLMSGTATYNITVILDPAALDQDVAVVKDYPRTGILLNYTCVYTYSALRFTLLEPPAHGVIQRKDVYGVHHEITPGESVEGSNGDVTGTWYYTPEAGYTGGDSLRWQVVAVWKYIEGESAPSEAVCSINIHTGNATPLVADSAADVVYPSGICELGAVTDADEGQHHTYHLVSGPSHGTLVTSTVLNTWTYHVTDPRFSGSDSFTWRAFDGMAWSDTATVIVDVIPQALVVEPTLSGSPQPIMVVPGQGFIPPFTGGGYTSMTVRVYSDYPRYGTLDIDGVTLTYTPNGDETHDELQWRIEWDDGTNLVWTGWVRSPLLIKGYSRDWPTFRHDVYRSGMTLHKLPSDLKLQWMREFPKTRGPSKGFHVQGVRNEYVRTDRCYHPVVMDQTMVVGFNADDTVRAFETATGAESWRFYTDGPVRLAPVLSRLDSGTAVAYVASDDGYVYCLNLEDSDCIWRHRAAPSKRKAFGDQRMVSAWPLRGGLMLDSGRLYFAGGLIPSDGAFVECRDVETGELIWRHDDEQTLRMMLYPQGYLVKNTLETVGGADGRGTFYVPSSDADTWLFRLEPRGEIQAQKTGGGLGYGWAIDMQGQIACYQKSGGHFEWPAAVTAGGVTYDEDWLKARGVVCARNQTVPRGTTMLAADDRLFVALASDVNSAYEDVVRLYCFGADDVSEPTIWPIEETPLPDVSDAWRDRVAEIVMECELEGESGVAYVFGLVQGRAAEEMLAQTGLHVVTVDADEGRVRALREKLTDAGLYGVRTSAILDVPMDAGLPTYMGRVIVCEDAAGAGMPPENAGDPEGRAFVKELFRILRPYGGAAWLPITSSHHSALAAWVAGADLVNAELTRQSGFSVLSRVGALPGALDNFDKYHEPISEVDEVVRGPLGVLWWGSDINQGHSKSSWQPDIVQGKIKSGCDKYTSFEPGEIWKGDVYSGLGYVTDQDQHSGIATGNDSPKVIDTDACKELGVSYNEPRWNFLFGLLERYKHGIGFGRFGSLGAGGWGFYSHQTGHVNFGMRGAYHAKPFREIPANGVYSFLWPIECVCSKGLSTSFSLVHEPEAVTWCQYRANRLHHPIEEDRIRRLAVNLGAPHDHMGTGGLQWIHQPYFHEKVWGDDSYYEARIEPWQPKRYYEHPALIESAEGPIWVASSGIRGIRELRLPMARSVVAQRCESEPALDGILSDACWDGAGGIDLARQASVVPRIANEPPVLHDYRGTAYVRYDDVNLYVGCRSEVAPGRWYVYLSDRRLVAANGATHYLELGVNRYGTLSGWTGEWSAAIGSDGEEWTLEVRVPWESLASEGLAWDTLLVNLVGPEEMHLRRTTSNEAAKTFVPVFYDQAPDRLVAQRPYTVRLHFAEPDAVAADERVFDVVMQGQTALSGFDIIQEAGGRRRGIVKEFNGVMIGKELALSFTPQTGEPVICGVEALAEFEDTRNRAPLLSASPAVLKSVAAGAKITVSALSSSLDPDGDDLAPVGWEMDGEPVTEGVTSGSSYLTRLTYLTTEADVGRHKIRVTVEDARGAQASYSWRAEITSATNQIPTADAYATPQVGLVPLTVDFDASASTDADGSIVSYRWTFGDPSSQGTDETNGPAVSHTYENPGSYVATVYVMDDAGAQDYREMTIHVFGARDHDGDGIPDADDPDDDNDGMPDVWEMANALNPLDATDANLDADGDGMLNLEEYIGGTDPTDPTSKLETRNLSLATPGVSLSFDSVASRLYGVEYCDDLTAPNWLNLTNDLPGTDGTLNVDDPTFGGTGPDMPGRRFYRIRVRLP